MKVADANRLPPSKAALLVLQGTRAISPGRSLMSTRPATKEALLTVYDDGKQAIGFLLRRGPAGVEAFSADHDSLGLFESEHDAASAI
jgi:hypothetical protein